MFFSAHGPRALPRPRTRPRPLPFPSPRRGLRSPPTVPSTTKPRRPPPSSQAPPSSASVLSPGRCFLIPYLGPPSQAPPGATSSATVALRLKVPTATTSIHPPPYPLPPPQIPYSFFLYHLRPPSPLICCHPRPSSPPSHHRPFHIRPPRQPSSLSRPDPSHRPELPPPPPLRFVASVAALAIHTAFDSGPHLSPPRQPSQPSPLPPRCPSTTSLVVGAANEGMPRVAYHVYDGMSKWKVMGNVAPTSFGTASNHLLLI